MRRRKTRPGRGAVVAIPLPGRGFGYGRMLSDSYVQLRDIFSDATTLTADEVMSSGIIATVFVSRYDTHAWSEIGVCEPTPGELSARLEFQHQDILSGQMFLRWSVVDPPSWGEQESTLAECGHLEPHVVWDAASHANRLADLREGRPPAILKSFAIDPDAARSFESGVPCAPARPGAQASSGESHDVVAAIDELGVNHGPSSGERPGPYAHLTKLDGEFTLTLACDGLPADVAVTASGHEPNGYFWERLLTVSAPDVVGHVELDSEAGAFVATGAKRALEELQRLLETLVADPSMVTALVARAEEAGFEFDD